MEPVSPDNLKGLSHECTVCGEWFYRRNTAGYVSRNTVLRFLCVGFLLIASVLYTTDPLWDLITLWMWKLVVCRCCFLLLWSRFTRC